MVEPLQSHPPDPDAPRLLGRGNEDTSKKRPGRRAHGVLLNLGFSVAGQIVSIASQVLTVPFFLRAWGDALYGDWLTLSALSSYLTLTDMGMQLYVINRLTTHEVRREKTEFDETLNSALLLYSALSLIALTVLLGLTFGLPWQHWFNGRAMNGAAVPGTVVLLGLSALVLVWCGFFGGMYRVFGRAQKTTAIGLVVRSALLVGGLLVLAAHRGPLPMAALQLLIPLLALGWLVLDVKREYSSISFSLAHANLRSAVAMMFPSALFAVLTLANGLTIQGTLLITSSLLGPVAVTGFATSRTVANVVRQMVTLLNTVAWPEFTRLGASGRSSELSMAHRLLVKVGSLLAVWLVSILWFTGLTLYVLWTRGRARFDVWLFRLLLIDVLLQTPAWASGVLLGATNRHRGLATLYLIQGALAVALCPLAIKAFGVVGVGVVLVATNFPLFGVLVPIWAQRELGESFREYFRDIYAKLVPVFGATMFVAWAMNRLGATGRWGVVVVVVTTFVPVVIGAAWWVRPAERQLAFSAFRRGK